MLARYAVLKSMSWKVTCFLIDAYILDNSTVLLPVCEKVPNKLEKLKPCDSLFLVLHSDLHT